MTMISTDRDRSSRSALITGLRAARGNFALIPLAVLIVLILAITVVQPTFLQPGPIQSLLLQAAPVLILAVGITPSILIGGLDLSIASLSSLAGVLLAFLTPGLGVAGVALVVVMCAAAGALVGYIHAIAQIPSFIVTLGALGLYAGVALVLSDASNLPIGAGASSIAWASAGIAALPASFVIALVVLVLAALYLSRSTFGRRLYAVGAAEPGAIVSGLSPLAVRVASYAFSGACAALAAVFLVARTGYAAPTLAESYLLPTIAAVLMGGTAISGGVGSLWRTLVGALIVVVLLSGLIVVRVDPAMANLVFGVAVIVAVGLTTDRRKLTIVK